MALYLALDTGVVAHLGSEKDSRESVLASVGQVGSGQPPDSDFDNPLLRFFFLFLVPGGWSCPKESGE